MTTNLQNTLKNFSSLTLTELNSTASFLKRIDTKFLLTIEQLELVLNDLKDDFKVLEIGWHRIFNYDNVYMDTEDYYFYNQHENQEKSRTKIRTRLYKESNMAFFEYKQKESWITRKFRYEFPVEEHGKMTKWKIRFFEWVWQSVYESKVVPKIYPAIKTEYKRITLVSKVWEERLTIDYDIKTNNLRDPNSKEVDLKNLVIIESKSLSEDCNSIRIIEKHWIKKANSCSKYSLWVIYSWIVSKFDTFKDTMAKIKEIRIDTLKNRFRKTKLENITKQNINFLEAEKQLISK